MLQSVRYRDMLQSEMQGYAAICEIQGYAAVYEIRDMLQSVRLGICCSL